ncbi:MAG: hypothetical protein U0V64_09340 [Cyclobacteriaceae bacterium]
MNTTLRQLITGTVTGLSPALACLAIFSLQYVIPSLNTGEARATTGLFISILYVFGSFAVFIYGAIAIMRSQVITGGLALVLQLVQIILLLAYLTSGTN